MFTKTNKNGSYNNSYIQGNAEKIHDILLMNFIVINKIFLGFLQEDCSFLTNSRIYMFLSYSQHIINHFPTPPIFLKTIRRWLFYSIDFVWVRLNYTINHLKDPSCTSLRDAIQNIFSMLKIGIWSQYCGIFTNYMHFGICMHYDETIYYIRKKVDIERVTSNVRLKFGFGIGNRNQGPISVSVSEPNFFFPKPKHFFFKFFSLFPTSLGK